jgi:hypothetical protein
LENTKKTTKAKIKKYYEFLTTKVHLMLEQKKFRHDDVLLKYILKKKESDTLVIVLSSCTRKGIKARYNYMRTLKDFNVNQLFILDDFGEDKRGSYYIGHDFKFDEDAAVKALVEKIADEIHAKTLIFCGSSKGGWAAVNFGLQFENSYVVAGGPQYFLADYLRDSGNLSSLKHIVGEETKEKLEKVNAYLGDRVKNDPFIATQHIYLHYSEKDHTYKEHIQYMLNDMKALGYDIKEDVEQYEDHSDISYYFPGFLVNSINDILGNNK